MKKNRHQTNCGKKERKYCLKLPRISSCQTISKKKLTRNNWIREETLREVEESLNPKVSKTLYKRQFIGNKTPKLDVIRKDKERFVEDQCRKIEKNATLNSTRELFKGRKSLTRKFCPTVDTIKDEAGVTLCDRDLVKDRCKEYCSKLYKKNENLISVNPLLNKSSPEPPPIFEEVKGAIKELKMGKSPGNDEVTAEMIKIEEIM